LLEAVGGLLAGLLAGTFGVGGGAITIPFLVFMLGLPLPMAIATNLVIVSINSIISMMVHLRQGTTNWRGIYMGSVGAATTLLGNELFLFASKYNVLNYVVGGVFVSLALVLMRIVDGYKEPQVWELVTVGALMGIYSALVGKGGGSLALPLLVMLFKVRTKEAVKVNVVATPIVASTAALEKVSMGMASLDTAFKFIPFMLLGSVVGAKVMKISKSETLKKAYSAFLFVVGASFILLGH